MHFLCSFLKAFPCCFEFSSKWLKKKVKKKQSIKTNNSLRKINKKNPEVQELLYKRDLLA